MPTKKEIDDRNKASREKGLERLKITNRIVFDNLTVEGFLSFYQGATLVDYYNYMKRLN